MKLSIIDTCILEHETVNLSTIAPEPQRRVRFSFSSNKSKRFTKRKAAPFVTEWHGYRQNCRPKASGSHRGAIVYRIHSALTVSVSI